MLDLGLEVGGVGAIDLGGDVRASCRSAWRWRWRGRPAFPARSDRGRPDIRPFHTAGSASSRAVRDKWSRPSPPGDGAALGMGNRHHRRLREGGKDRLLLRQVEPAVERSYERGRLPQEQGEGQVIEVEMQDIELGRALPHSLQHHHMQGQRVEDLGEAQRGGPNRLENAPPSLNRRWRTGSRRAPAGHQFLGEPGHHTLCAAIGFRRNGLIKGGDLCNAHSSTPTGKRKYQPVPARPRPFLDLGYKNGAKTVIFPAFFVASVVWRLLPLIWNSLSRWIVPFSDARRWQI